MASCFASTVRGALDVTKLLKRSATRRVGVHAVGDVVTYALVNVVTQLLVDL